MVDVQVYLHELLERKGVSRAELARRMGISRARVTQMFAHDSNLTIRQLARAAHHLGEEPHVESETTRALRSERDDARNEAALAASPNVVRLWKDVSALNPVDATCSGEDRRIDGIVLLARRTGTR
jgi:transcriptional regulator with XRE-family HTH domain